MSRMSSRLLQSAFNYLFKNMSMKRGQSKRSSEDLNSIPQVKETEWLLLNETVTINETELL